MINGFKAYFQRHGQAVYENPSPGNKDGGITTLEEKPLGCVQKGGASAVVDVLPYGGRVAKPGLNFLTGPGNDIVSLTALTAAGALLVLFTTGRGTPLGGPVPTLKIASNSELAARKPGWIDFDAGRLIGGMPLAALADGLLDFVLLTADVQRAERFSRDRDLQGWRDPLAKFEQPPVCAAAPKLCGPPVEPCSRRVLIFSGQEELYARRPPQSVGA